MVILLGRSCLVVAILIAIVLADVLSCVLIII